MAVELTARGPGRGERALVRREAKGGGEKGTVMRFRREAEGTPQARGAEKRAKENRARDPEERRR